MNLYCIQIPTLHLLSPGTSITIRLPETLIPYLRQQSPLPDMEKLSPTSSTKHDFVEEAAVDDPSETTPVYDEQETKAILRKIDWRLLPMLTLLYVLSYIDRSNIGNAKVAGMNDDLNLTGSQYNIALTVFFFPYALFEVPSNMVLKVIRPSIWIGVMMLTWGVVLTLMGIVQNFSGLAGARTAVSNTRNRGDLC